MVNYQVGQFATSWLHSNESQRSPACSASKLYNAFMFQSQMRSRSMCDYFVTRWLYITARYTERNPIAPRTGDCIKEK